MDESKTVAHMSIPQETHTTTKQNNTISDPLFGIIKGNSRLERYQEFSNKIIGSIWKNNSQDKFGFDYWRSQHFDGGNKKAMLFKVHQMKDPGDLSVQDFEKFVNHIGSADYIRVRVIPSDFTSSQLQHIPVGGSCVLETWAMKIIHELLSIKKDDLNSTELKSKVERYILQITQMAPTMTHISGGVLGGQDDLIHLIESDMWTSLLQKWGIPENEAIGLVDSAYSRINESLTRRSKLININSEVHSVNFDSLNLKKSVREWLHSMGMEWKENFRLMEVLYTYLGEHQFENLTSALKSKLKLNGLSLRQKVGISRLLSYNTHTRMKQIDHLTVAEVMEIPQEEALKPIDAPVSKSKYENSHATGEDRYNYKCIVKMIRWVQSTNTPNTRRVGFADMPYGNQIAHQERNMGSIVKGKPGTQGYFNSLNDVLNSPTRLHHNNISEHLKYLESFLIDYCSEKKQLISKRMLFNQQLIEILKGQNKISLEKKLLYKKKYEREKEMFEQAGLESKHAQLDKKAVPIKAELTNINNRIKNLTKHHPFPLNKNPFVMHAFNFMWDSDFCSFLIKCVGIQNKRDSLQSEDNTMKIYMSDVSIKEMLGLMKKIYPKIKSYYLYIYGYSEYPVKLRNTRLF
ncbi:hypothetical protein COY90_05605 [Candidatus Roizmanbacteria bacterium CG_4_10_14_0_8_um_filter_39_9]|uniref:Uncharacterized protein n=1 Tax=Candidatus Roizmanbacteria bacterium CG_4_10_14_0_8_um_filter_39_9 TaxID=1974829 RepID=A0A2M7QC58_9BACT|nr:MAG: hypothetical protein COY90_05605 [Candidatus Roizmanbacteria bacterium CG_4_10_14_0_8_um_filter_39_9]